IVGRLLGTGKPHQIAFQGYLVLQIGFEDRRQFRPHFINQPLYPAAVYMVAQFLWKRQMATISAAGSLTTAASPPKPTSTPAPFACRWPAWPWDRPVIPGRRTWRWKDRPPPPAHSRHR